MSQISNIRSVPLYIFGALWLLCMTPPVAAERLLTTLNAQLMRQHEYAQVEAVQAYFNRLRRISDADLWGRNDYWATPDELLRAGGGDCEDLATAKYFKLRELGVPTERLRLAYARVFDNQRQVIEPHMVLWYRYDVASDWQVLDSLTPQIQYLSLRTDLLPRLIFNENHVAYWHADGGETRLGGPELIGRWQELLRRQQTGQSLASSPSDRTS